MRVFLDFEASSLAQDSYPIEVGWVFEDGRGGEAHLIRPAPAWTDWDASAEAIHHIPRSRLEAEGEPHEAVAARMLEALSAHVVYASAPSWDGKWLSVLLRAAGLPRHAMRLNDVHEAHVEAAREALASVVDDGGLEAAVRQVLAEIAREARSPAHRALADAEQELGLWLDVRRAAQAYAGRLVARQGRRA
jgi:hypothetical protein